MKLTDILFWILIAIVAFFYLTTGNDMYQEKHQMIDNKRAEIVAEKKASSLNN